MHAGAIDNPKSAAGRVYKILLEDVGCWFSGWDLTVQARVTAVGTRVSEVRHQLPAGQRIEHQSTNGKGGHGSWYRLVVDVEPRESDFPAGQGVKNCPCTLVALEKPSAPLIFTEAGEALRERARMLADRHVPKLGTVTPQMKLDIQ